MCEEYLELLQEGKNNRCFILQMTAGVAQIFRERSGLWQDLCASPFKPIVVSMEAVDKFSRCLLYLFDEQVPNVDGQLTCAATPADLFGFTDYNGADVYTCATRNILVKNGSWYAAQTSEVARAAATRLTLQPKIDRMKSLLEVVPNAAGEPAPISTAGLQELVSLYNEAILLCRCWLVAL